VPGGCNSATQRQNCVKTHGRNKQAAIASPESFMCAAKVALVAHGFHSLAGDVVPQ